MTGIRAQPTAEVADIAGRQFSTTVVGRLVTPNGVRWRGRGRAEEDGAVSEPSFAERLGERTATAEAQRAALVRAITEMRLARSLTFADDEHDPEGSTVSLDQARDVALLEQVDATLAELRAAQQRWADGAYGVCDTCGEPIAAARLAARPEARVCIRCARRTTARR